MLRSSWPGVRFLKKPEWRAAAAERSQSPALRHGVLEHRDKSVESVITGRPGGLA